MKLEDLRAEIANCRLCVESPLKEPLPHEPRPVLQVSQTAKICVCGQAPGTRVHQSGRPFTDPSGDRLRDWMGIGEDLFYDHDRVAIVPMGFCFPGLDAKGGDLPPRRECRVTWHDRLFAAMPQVELVLAVGRYAQTYHMGAQAGATTDLKGRRPQPGGAGPPLVAGGSLCPLPRSRVGGMCRQ